MQIKKIELNSNILHYVSLRKNVEVKQQLKVFSDGKVYFSGYSFGEEFEEYLICRQQQFLISRETAEEILSLLARYFENSPKASDNITDNGRWELIITETDGNVTKYVNSLSEMIDLNNVNLSMFLRQHLSIEELFAFDGGGLTTAEIPNSASCDIISFPQYEEIKREVRKLGIELSMLLLERDELLFVECPNLETSYMLVLGGLEHKVYNTECKLLRLKRKLELIRARKNRQEKIIASEIEKILDQEFEEYQKKLKEQIEKMNEALKRGQAEKLSESEAREIKAVYRRVVKKLHPDLHPNINDAELKLFQNAVEAYKNGDLISMRVINEMLGESDEITTREDPITQIVREKERLTNLLKSLTVNIIKIKAEYPYTMKELLQSREKIAERKAELNDTLKQYEEMISTYSQKIKEMLG